MPSLRDLTPHLPALVLDAASSQVQVGLLEADRPGRWFSSSDEAGVAVFRGVEQLRVDPLRVGVFVFCEGPGSVLGIRTVAMALRTWTLLAPRPVYAYCSLAVVAHALRDRDLAVIADARRETWHHYRIGTGLRRVTTAELSGELVMPEGFRHWSAAPPSFGRVPYSLADLFPRIGNDDLLHETSAPDAFLHEEPSYVTWTPRVHQAPGRESTAHG
jgi:tRNA threonylcarbamoyladenosine biosynthesis protein TsaB